MPRGTPLYGQPSWWGDDDVEEKRAFKSNDKPEEKSLETVTPGKKKTQLHPCYKCIYEEEFMTKKNICLS